MTENTPEALRPRGPANTPRERVLAVIRLLPVWTVRELRAQYRQSALDFGWALVTPAATLVGYGFVLTQAFDVTGDGVPYVVFAWTGIVVWTFAASSLLRGATSLVTSAEIVRKAPFPKEVPPLAAVALAAVELAMGLVVLAVMLVVDGRAPTITAAAAVPVLAVLAVWASAWSMIFAAATAFVRDVAHGLGVVLRIGIFVTPVMYPPSDIPERFQWTVNVNPLAVMIDGVRVSLLNDEWPDWELIGVHGAVSVVLLVVAWRYVQRVDGRIADVI